MKRITLKEGICLVVFAFGIATIIYAVHSMQKIKHAKENVHGLSALFHGSPTGEIFSGVMQKKASSYDETVIWLLVGGIALFLIGLGVFWYNRTRK